MFPQALSYVCVEDTPIYIWKVDEKKTRTHESQKTKSSSNSSLTINSKKWFLIENQERKKY